MKGKAASTAKASGQPPNRKERRKELQRNQTNVVKTKRSPLNRILWFLGKAMKWGWKLFAGAAVIVGLLVAFYPKIDVSTGPSINPKNIFLTPFVVSNDGFLSVSDVDVLTGLKEIRLIHKNLTIKADKDFAARFIRSNNTLSELKPGEKYTVLNPFNYHLSADVIAKGAEYADIAIVVSFTCPFLPVKMERCVRFRTSKAADGELIWYKQPMAAKSFF